MGANPSIVRCGAEQHLYAGLGKGQRRPARHRHRSLQRGGPGRGVPAPRRGRVRAGQTGDGERRPRPRTSPRKSSSGCGTSPIASTPTRGSLRSFLLAQSHGRAVDVIRSSSSRRRREARDAFDTARSSYDMQHEVWDLAVADQVSTAMGSLPDEERRAIELAYFDGRTYREVAQLLGQPEGTVKSRIRNGMRRMRAVLVGCRCQGSRTRDVARGGQ